jgi:hypothetical protein
MRDAFFSLGIILTAILGAWNLANNYRLTRRTSFINTVTAERVKWIEKLRDNLSTYCGLLFTWQASNLAGGKPESLDFEKGVDRLRYLIRLQLNPAGAHDKAIEDLIARIPYLTDKTKINELHAALNELVVVSQQLLKEEWDKVKEEAKRGDLKDTENCVDRILRNASAFCLKVTSRWA